jgi:hypothetical protein
MVAGDGANNGATLPDETGCQARSSAARAFPILADLFKLRNNRGPPAAFE